MNTESFGQRVKASREKQGISLSKLADIAGMSKGYLCELEGGKNRAPSVYIALNLASALGVTVEHLAFGVESEERDSHKATEIAQLKRRLAKIAALAEGDEPEL